MRSEGKGPVDGNPEGCGCVVRGHSSQRASFQLLVATFVITSASADIFVGMTAEHCRQTWPNPRSRVHLADVQQ